MEGSGDLETKDSIEVVIDLLYSSNGGEAKIITAENGEEKVESYSKEEKEIKIEKEDLPPGKIKKVKVEGENGDPVLYTEEEELKGKGEIDVENNLYTGEKIKIYVDDREVVPVLIVPGLFGSRRNVSANGKERFWEMVEEAYRKANSKKSKQAKKNNEKSEKNSLQLDDRYDTIVDKITEMENEELETDREVREYEKEYIIRRHNFTYDYEGNFGDVMGELKRHIDKVIKDYKKGDGKKISSERQCEEVIIVAHSLGGVIAKSTKKGFNLQGKIKKTLYIGAPKETPKSLLLRKRANKCKLSFLKKIKEYREGMLGNKEYKREIKEILDSEEIGYEEAIGDEEEGPISMLDSILEIEFYPEVEYGIYSETTDTIAEYTSAKTRNTKIKEHAANLLPKVKQQLPEFITDTSPTSPADLALSLLENNIEVFIPGQIEYYTVPAFLAYLGYNKLTDKPSYIKNVDYEDGDGLVIPPDGIKNEMKIKDVENKCTNINIVDHDKVSDKLEKQIKNILKSNN